MITEEEVNLEITEGNRAESGRVYRNIEVSLLDISWIFQKGTDGKHRDFGDLVKALAKAPHESLFGTDLINILVDNFWHMYSVRIKLLCMGPFMIYAFFCLFYFTHYAQGNHKTI